jgi:hypothetical protein
MAFTKLGGSSETQGRAAHLKASHVLFRAALRFLREFLKRTGG